MGSSDASVFCVCSNEGLRHAKADVQCLDLKCYKKCGSMSMSALSMFVF